MQKQEKNLLVSQTGFATLRELLERRRLVGREEWSDLWESKMDYQLHALEKRERFMAITRPHRRPSIRATGRKLFAQHLDDAEYALFAFDVDARASAPSSRPASSTATNYELALFLGETCFNEGDTEAALGYFQTRPRGEARPLRGARLLRRHPARARRLRSAPRRCSRSAVAELPRRLPAALRLGAVYAAHGELSRAVAYLEQAMRSTAVPQALYLLGNCCYEMGQAAHAIRSLREAVRLDPAFEEAHYLLGLAYLDRHWNKQGARRRSARRSGSIPRRLRYQDLVQFLSGRTGAPLPEVGAEAARYMAKAEEHRARGERDRARSPLPEGARRRARESDAADVVRAALPARSTAGRSSRPPTRRVLELEPRRDAARDGLGRADRGAAQRGQVPRGQPHRQRAARRGGVATSRSTIAYYEMAYNLAEMEEDLDQALDYARRALDLAPDELKQFPLAALGWVHYKRKEYDQAVECLARSNELGSSPTTLTHLGMALLAAGRGGEGARRLRPGAEPRAARRRARGEDDGVHARLVAAARARAAAAEAIAAETRSRSETPVTL